MSVGAHQKLAERALRLQGAAAGRGGVHGVGDAPRQDSCTQRFPVYWLFRVRGGDNKLQCGRPCQFAIRASYSGIHYHHINYPDINYR